MTTARQLAENLMRCAKGSGAAVPEIEMRLLKAHQESEDAQERPGSTIYWDALVEMQRLRGSLIRAAGALDRNARYFRFLGGALTVFLLMQIAILVKFWP